MKSATINGMTIYPQDVWIERTNSYGHYKLCLILNDATTNTATFADSQIWDEYDRFDDDQAEEAFDFIIGRFENRLAGMIPTQG